MARLSLHRSLLLLGLWVQLFATSAAADPIQEQEAFLQAFLRREHQVLEGQPQEELRHGLLRLGPRPYSNQRPCRR